MKIKTILIDSEIFKKKVFNIMDFIKSFSMLFFLFLLLFNAITASGENLVIAENGKSKYQIVLPEKNKNAFVDAFLLQAAKFIQTSLKESTDAELPIIRESEKKADLPGIFLGNTKTASENGIDATKFKDWEYVIKAVKGNLFIAGNDYPGIKNINNFSFHSLGTSKAATSFLYKYVNVRFLMPGADGRACGKMEKIIVPDNTDIREKPLFEYCTSRNKEIFYDLANNFLSSTKYGTHGGHSHEIGIPPEKYFKTNPEFFTLINGKRYFRPGFPNYCISNPQAQELIYQELLSHSDQGYEIVQLGQSDGFTPCQCDKCRDLYGIVPTSKYGTRESYQDPAWGEKLWIMHRAMAERFLKDRPDKKVAIMAYGPTANPPSTFKDFPQNVIVEMARNDKEAFEKWKDIKVPGGFFVYIYNWGSYHNTGFMPKRTPEFAVNQVRLFRENNVKGIYRCGFGELFGVEGPVYYLYGQLLGDPDKDPSSILDEYYKYAYGPAEIPMKNFFDLLHKRLALDINRSEDWNDIELLTAKRNKGDESFFIILMRYPENVLESLEKYLSEAEKSQNMSPEAVKRTKITRIEFDYLKLTAMAVNSFFNYSKNPAKENFLSFKNALEKRSAFINQLSVSKEKEPRILPSGSVPLFGSEPKSLVLSGGRLATSPTAVLNFDLDFLEKQDILPGSRMFSVKRIKSESSSIPEDKQFLLDPLVDRENTVFKEKPTFISCKYDNKSFKVIFICTKTTMKEIESDKFIVTVAHEKPLKQYLNFICKGNSKQASVSVSDGNAEKPYTSKAKTDVSTTEVPSTDTVLLTLDIPWEFFKCDGPPLNETWSANFTRLKKEPKADYKWEPDLAFYKSQKSSREILGKIKFE